MDNQKKLEMFAQTIYNEAMAERDRITDEIEKRVADDMEKCENEALSDSYELIQRSRGEIERESAERVSGTSFELKRRLIALRESLVDEVFADVEKKLAEFSKTEEYKAYIKRALDEGKSFGGDLIAEVNSADAQALTDFILKNGAKKVNCADLKGGIRVIAEEKGIVIDKSFDTALRDKRGSFNMNE
ncbi:MAG: V-type ATP synthase subunit E [Clostridia bacterium]